MTSSVEMDIETQVSPARAAPAPVAPPQPAASERHRVASSPWTELLGRAVTSLPKGAWMAIDAVLVFIGLQVGYEATPWDASDPAVQIAFWKAWMLSALTLAVSGSMLGLYEEAALTGKGRLILRPIAAVLIAVCVAYFVISGALYAAISRRIVVWMAGTYILGAIGLRAAAAAVLAKYHLKVLIVGTGPSARITAKAIASSSASRYDVVGLIATDPLSAVRPDPGEFPVLGDVADLPALCAQHHIREVIIDGHEQSDSDVVEAALSCLKMGCRVTNDSTFYEKSFGEVPVSRIRPQWFLFADLAVHREELITSKRVVDVILSATGLLVTLPLWPLIAAAVKMSSPGPVLHRQVRVGQGGQNFTLCKFRSMHVDAEPHGPMWASANDPRAFRVGKWLRKSHLDELPQLWNILKGNMSLVGPRPERPDLAKMLAQKIRYYNERHLVKPGLTGWAQINFHYGSTVDDTRRKLQLDLYYVKNMSLELDMVIMLRTVGAVLTGDA